MTPQSVGSAFTRACQLLGIKDLRFHDLRYEAASRLFERGYQIHEVAQFTLHDSWNELKRYANLKPENVRDIALPPGASGLHDRLPGAIIVAPRLARDVGRSARRDPPH